MLLRMLPLEVQVYLDLCASNRYSCYGIKDGRDGLVWTTDVCVICIQYQIQSRIRFWKRRIQL
jgi:hypothetical protein